MTYSDDDEVLPLESLPPSRGGMIGRQRLTIPPRSRQHAPQQQQSSSSSSLASILNSASASSLAPGRSAPMGYPLGKPKPAAPQAKFVSDDEDDGFQILSGPGPSSSSSQKPPSSSKLAPLFANGTSNGNKRQKLKSVSPDLEDEESGYGQGGSGSGSGGAAVIAAGGGSAWEKKMELNRELSKLDTEIKSVEDQISPLQLLHTQLLSSRTSLLTQISSLSASHANGSSSSSNHNNGKGSGSGGGDTVNYLAPEDEFEWAGQMKQSMKEMWGIESYRLCQEGVCNANMDGRDILCIMPTGGGKSLTYQLPALLTPGTTIVISPLISLITDQIVHLKEAGVECVMMTGATSKEDQNDAFRRMSDGPTRRGSSSDEIKLCYVTPEKVAKSKRFVSVLEKMNSAGRLARIVIDEAHCCSQLGHDFRPDYKKLSILKQLFPHVPILAVTATLSHKVLPDLLKILRLPPLTIGKAANTTGTVYFTSPLYRKNLHYSVVSKPTNAKTAIEKMAKYIMDKHSGHNGIVYCLSKKDSEVVAEGLRTASNGTIKTGVYHADIGDAEKQRIYMGWREGKVQCICATIAFGLGIDNPNTRYVLHHSISKSMDGYYQETGRAGRDGDDADCVLFFRQQDASRISSLTLGETDGQSKLHEMLRYAQDLKTCRKVAFAKYFSTSASMPTNAWDSSPTGTIRACGHCDNCLRPASSTSTKDVTLDAWRILKVAEVVAREGGRVTLSGLGDLVRGLGGGSFGTQERAGGKRGRGKTTKGEGNVDLAELVGGKVALSKDDTESLLIDMLLQGYLAEDYHATAYAVNVYLQPAMGSLPLRLSRLTKQQALSGNDWPFAVECTFPVQVKAKRATKASGKGKSRGAKKQADDDEESDDDDDEEDLEDIDLEEEALVAEPSRRRAQLDAQNQARRAARNKQPLSFEPDQGEGDVMVLDSDEDDDEGDGWREGSFM